MTIYTKVIDKHDSLDRLISSVNKSLEVEFLNRKPKVEVISNQYIDTINATVLLTFTTRGKTTTYKYIQVNSTAMDANKVFDLLYDALVNALLVGVGDACIKSILNGADLQDDLIVE